MNYRLFTYYAIILVMLISCTSDNGEDMKLDCSESDLSLSVITSTDPTCNTAGSFEVAATGGKSPYRYAIDTTQYQTSGVFDDLEVGSYLVFVKDENGCVSTSEVTFQSDEAIGVTLSVSGCGNDDGEISVDASGGNGEYQYGLNGDEFGSSSTFQSLASGEYFVTVRDGNGCETKSSTVKIGVSLDADIVPIIELNCAKSGCHLNNQSPLMDTKDAMIAAASKIQNRTTAGTMPPSGPLDQHDIELISDWVDCGAPDN
ncbi:MAG: hypothetical protein JXQ90_06615 [Cyclobacteriaceae bacterium]